MNRYITSAGDYFPSGMFLLNTDNKNDVAVISKIFEHLELFEDKVELDKLERKFFIDKKVKDKKLDLKKAALQYVENN